LQPSYLCNVYVLLPSLHHNKGQNIMFAAYYEKCGSKQNLNCQAF